MLKSECPNCGRLHKGADFDAEPGPVQAQLQEAQQQIGRMNEQIANHVRDSELLAEAEKRAEKLREEIKRAIERLEKFGRKGPKQVGRALIGLEAALAPEPTEPPPKEPRYADPHAESYCGILFPVGRGDALYCNREEGHDSGCARLPWPDGVAATGEAAEPKEEL